MSEDALKDLEGRDLVIARHLAEQLLPHHLQKLADFARSEIKDMNAQDDEKLTRAVLRAFSQSELVLEITEPGIKPKIRLPNMPVGPESIEQAARFLEDAGRKRWRSVKTTLDRLKRQLNDIYGDELEPDDEEALSRLSVRADRYSKRTPRGNFPKNTGLIIRAIWPVLKDQGIPQNRAANIMAKALVRQGITEERDGLGESIRQSIHYIEI